MSPVDVAGAGLREELMRHSLILACVGLLVGSFAMSFAPTSDSVTATLEAAQDNPIAMSEESIAAGRAVYSRFCANCHGARGLGDGSGAYPDTEPANLVDDQWDHGSSDAEIFKTIAEGVPPDYGMEEWLGRISEEDIWNVINYLRDLGNQ